MDWYEVKFLESPVNLKGFMKESIGTEHSTNIATEISTCLQQGRLFFEAANNAPLKIKPLQVFYGVVGFSKALTSARNIISTRDLSQAHGLKDRSESNARLVNKGGGQVFILDRIFWKMKNEDLTPAFPLL